ncbi:MAG: AMP-binding protein [Pseudomonadota bacterium]|nr:AMP-binding protein [Pseudomonadota bacterium]
MFDLGRTLLASVERSPRALAIVDGSLRLTYAQWLDRIERVAGGLSTLGLRRGDHLVTVLQNRWEAATLHWACQLLGIVITPLNWRATGDEIDYCATDADARAIAYEGVTAAAVREAKQAGLLRRIFVGEAPAAAGAHPFETLLAADRHRSGPLAHADDPSVMLYTSGTTGRSKGVPRRHRQERAAAVAHVAQNFYASGEVTLGVMPLYHTMGVRSLLAMALVDGCFACLPRFDAARALEIIEAERVTTLYLVPTLYHDLLSHPSFAATNVTSAQKLGFAGAPMPAALLQRVSAAFRPALFVNHYGSSEIYTFTVDQKAVEKPGSAGKAGINQRIRVVKLGAESPQALAAGAEEGQIIADIASDEAFDGYWRRPDADARGLRDGWYFSGDTGYFDADGDLFVTGRVDDMIISGGENISPVDIESVLSLHAGVDEVAVAGVPDERWGQRVVAFVKRKLPINANTLDAHCCGSNLASFKRPREYVFVREIPKSPVGKIMRRKLVAGEFDED